MENVYIMTDMILCKYCDNCNKYGECTLGYIHEPTVHCSFFSIEKAKPEEIIETIKRVWKVEHMDKETLKHLGRLLSEATGKEVEFCFVEEMESETLEECDEEIVDEFTYLKQKLCQLTAEELSSLLMNLPFDLFNETMGEIGKSIREYNRAFY